MKIKDEKLDMIIGGATSTLSGPILTAITNIIKVLFDAGKGFGEGIRRMVESDICPLP